MKGDFVMKKILTIISVVLMMLCFGVSAFAASGSFTSSPGAKSAPVLVESENGSEDCDAKVVIIAYSNRNTMDAADKAQIEAAYKSIASTGDLGSLGYDLNVMANDLGISSEQLFVSDLFGVSYDNCDEHALHQDITVTIKPATAEKYVGLMCYKNGEWRVVEEVTVEDGKLTFSFDETAPYAIVVHDGGLNGGDAPINGSSDMDLKLLAALIIFISLIGIAIIAHKLKDA